ncbi:gliding motility lipoprotein GldH [Hymenobacter chitinivorans]|uniref:Gliding motility-associated lipoprotein GldH n=1 Tax=Hymenobacter chitinivorans DSM 11115 TaxID=1121954 RepID=A0A2M9BA97_9BACT|nr:gliding motility lipoprotein GldH [Hymenobacter chitinivorans]PJJ54863.1 gliding motility-associated lipoprotein GldH [Hymenobacter chitinivorans DSM 11115]
MRHGLNLVAGLALLVGLAACDANQVYEKNQELDKAVWTVQEKPTFEFDIQDTTQRYDIYFNIRNESMYGYYNLYVKHTLLDPSGKRMSQLLHQMLLMDPQTGEPRGQGSGDIFDHQFLALRQQKFAQPGTYRVVLEQYMRQDQLPGIMAVGVRVAKAAE